MSSLPTDYFTEEYIITRKALKKAKTSQEASDVQPNTNMKKSLAALKISYEPAKDPFIIGCCGGSASGKTTGIAIFFADTFYF